MPPPSRGFGSREQLFTLMEELWAKVWLNVAGIEISTPFRRMTWDEAQLRYAMDKPDLRFELELVDVCGGEQRPCRYR